MTMEDMDEIEYRPHDDMLFVLVEIGWWSCALVVIGAEVGVRTGLGEESAY